jgi:hypothetical protein
MLLPLFRCFQTMVHAVSNDVGERIFHRFQDALIDFDVVTSDY